MLDRRNRSSRDISFLQSLVSRRAGTDAHTKGGRSDGESGLGLSRACSSCDPPCSACDAVRWLGSGK
jgi:hypothetical protein